MNSPADSPLEAVCPYCRGKIPMPTDPEAKSARCPKCHEKVPVVLLEARVSSAKQVVSQSSTASPTGSPSTEQAAASQKPAPPSPTEVRVKCKLCGTIIYAPIGQVSQQVKCPDCDSMNKVPEPPKPQKKVEVKLEEADTFRLQESLDQPDKDSASSKQRWYMAKCPTCFSQFRLTVEHAGEQIKCPDCHTDFTAAEPPPEPKQQTTVVVDDSYELKLSDPVERPPIDVDDLISSKEMPLGRELQAAAGRGDLDSREKLESMHTLVKGEEQNSTDKAESSQRPERDAEQPRLKADDKEPSDKETDAVHEIDDEAFLDEAEAPAKPWKDKHAAAPKRPWYRLNAQSMFFKKLLLTDLRTFASETGVIVRWVILMLLIGGTLYLGASMLEAYQQERSLMSDVTALSLSLVCGLLLLVCLLLTANTFLPVVISASLEESQVEDWPPFSPGEWLFQSLYIVNAIAIGALPTMILIPIASAYVIAVFQWLLIVPIFPIAILSMLDEGSPFGPYAPGLWRLVSVFRGLWLRFTVVGYAMAGVGMLLAGLTIYTGSLLLAILSGPAIATLIVVYGRFLGRLAMFMSEQSSPQESLAEYDE